MFLLFHLHEKYNKIIDQGLMINKYTDNPIKKELEKFILDGEITE